MNLESISRTGLEITRVMNWDEAQELTAKIDKLESGMQFAIGDWLNYCEATFGEKFAQLVPQGNESSWLVYKWVASRCRDRYESLTWTHHRAVASLLHERQAVYLQKAKDQGISVSSLKRLISEGKEVKVVTITCPLCGGTFNKE